MRDSATTNATAKTQSTDSAGNLLTIARKVERLPPPGHRDPEKFWRDKSDLADQLRRVARTIR